MKQYKLVGWSHTFVDKGKPPWPSLALRDKFPFVVFGSDLGNEYDKNGQPIVLVELADGNLRKFSLRWFLWEPVG